MNSEKIKDNWIPRNNSSKKIVILPTRWRHSNRMSMMQNDTDFPEDMSHDGLIFLYRY